MARYTKIPESNISGAMGKMLGRMSGELTSRASTQMNKMKDRLMETVNNLTNESYTSVRNKVYPIERSLSTIERSLSALNYTSSTLQRLASTLRYPVTTLQWSIRIIKWIPMMQWYLPVSVTTIYSDLLEMLSETVAQLKEMSDSLISVTNTIKGSLSPIIVQIAQIRKIIQALKIKKSFPNSYELSRWNRDKLTNIGFYDKNGKSLIDTLITGISGTVQNGDKEMYLGNSGEVISLYGTKLDLTDVALRNRVSLAKEGDRVTLQEGTGDYIHEVYNGSREKPKKPVGRKLIPEGWTDKVPTGKFWVSRTVVSGTTGRAGSWSDVEEGITGPILPTVNAASESIKIIGVRDILNLRTDRVNNLEGILRLNPEDVSGMLTTMVNRAGTVGLSSDLEQTLRETLQFFEEKEKEQSIKVKGKDVRFDAPDGTVYWLRVVVDPKSPSIAPRRYVTVLDVSGKVNIMDGEKSFSEDEDSLIEEMKIRLTQMLTQSYL